MTLMLTTHYTRAADFVVPDQMVIEPAVPVTTYRDGFGNWCTRLVAPAGRMQCQRAGCSAIAVKSIARRMQPVSLTSRICRPRCWSSCWAAATAKRIGSLVAWSLFGHGSTGVGRVRAICDFVHQHIPFNYQDARSTRTALEAFNERKGVCRDFAHLAITFCSCLNIPARYCTGYLGDIGVPPVVCRWISARGSRRTSAASGTSSTPATTSHALVEC